MGITWTLSSQYGSGLRASGSIVDLVDPVYSDDVLTYSFTNTSMTGTVPSGAAILTCCETPPLMMVSASHQEYIYAETSIGLNLVASDQQVALTSSAALVAHATGLTCRVWNGTWGSPMALLTDLECPSFTVSAFWGRAYVVGLKDNGGAWDLYAWRAPIVAGEPVVETGSETLVASSVDEVSPTIVERPDGVLHVSYLTGGALEMKRSNDGGSTWEAVS